MLDYTWPEFHVGRARRPLPCPADRHAAHTLAYAGCRLSEALALITDRARLSAAVAIGWCVATLQRQERANTLARRHAI
jgi:hypothetical protein